MTPSTRATASHIVISGGSSVIQVLNDVLWTRGGYDLSVADDSRVGFTSDYNDLYSSGAGILVHWDVNFNDILDWQDDVNQYDLHSVGRTIVNPTNAQPRFYDSTIGDYRVFDLAVGQRVTSLTQGMPIP